jgi:Reverse transcriptase (RNA-dependent DNA polymerase)
LWPKKNGTLRTVFDLWEQNENTVKDVTPFPDQDIIRNDIARAAYRTKLDMSEAYEQICVDPAHVSKTAFAIIPGTFRSQVMEMGDWNTPSTFQRLMTAIFRDCIGRFIHVYMDDIFIFLCSIEEHEKHLVIVFDRLHKNHLFLSKKKVDLYSESMECLGHIIDDRGIHADTDKMQRVREQRTPRMYNDVQRFLRLVQYLAHYVRIHNPPSGLCKKQPSIRVDTALRQIPAEHQGSGMQSVDPKTSGSKESGPHLGHNGWIQVRDRRHVRARPRMADLQVGRLPV